ESSKYVRHRVNQEDAFNWLVVITGHELTIVLCSLCFGLWVLFVPLSFGRFNTRATALCTLQSFSSSHRDCRRRTFRALPCPIPTRPSLRQSRRLQALR